MDMGMNLLLNWSKYYSVFPNCHRPAFSPGVNLLLLVKYQFLRKLFCLVTLFYICLCFLCLCVAKSSNSSCHCLRKIQQISISKQQYSEVIKLSFKKKCNLESVSWIWKDTFFCLFPLQSVPDVLTLCRFCPFLCSEFFHPHAKKESQLAVKYRLGWFNQLLGWFCNKLIHYQVP